VENHYKVKRPQSGASLATHTLWVLDRRKRPTTGGVPPGLAGSGGGDGRLGPAHREDDRVGAVAPRAQNPVLALQLLDDDLAEVVTGLEAQGHAGLRVLGGVAVPHDGRVGRDLADAGRVEQLQELRAPLVVQVLAVVRVAVQRLERQGHADLVVDLDADVLHEAQVLLERVAQPGQLASRQVVRRQVGGDDAGPRRHVDEAELARVENAVAGAGLGG